MTQFQIKTDRQRKKEQRKALRSLRFGIFRIIMLILTFIVTFTLVIYNELQGINDLWDWIQYSVATIFAILFLRVLIIPFILPGFFQPEEKRINKAIESNRAEWGDHYCNLLLEDKFTFDMTREMVYTRLGPPDAIHFDEDEQGREEEIWFYEHRWKMVFRNNKLKRFVHDNSFRVSPRE